MSDRGSYSVTPDSSGNPTNQSGAHKQDVQTEHIALGNMGGSAEKSNDDTDIERQSSDRNAADRMNSVSNLQTSIVNFFTVHETNIWRTIYVIIIILYAVYFTYALYFRFGDEGSIRLLWMTCLVSFICVVNIFRRIFGRKFSRITRPVRMAIRAKDDIIAWVFFGILFLAVLIFIIVDATLVSRKPYNLVSASGIIMYILLFFIFSKNPAAVRWRPVAWGLGLQFVLALLILRTVPGYVAFKWLGERVAEFLEHTYAGTILVFGTSYEQHFVAFKVLPVIIFFSTVISMLYHLGWMQIVIHKMAYVMQQLMGTTAGESLNAAANIFLGLAEAPLVIRPLIQKLTKSELHAVMTGGFATIAGSVMAAYILSGVPANHLLSASVMSAPAALAMSKLIYPETEKSKTTAKDVQYMPPGTERNILEAASAGASTSIKLVAAIAANLIAFMGLLQFANATLIWFGHRVGIEKPQYPELTFQLICAYLLWPFALVMGIDIQDCHKVAELIGIKIFLTEFVSFAELSVLRSNRQEFLAYNGTVQYTGSDVILVGINKTLTGGFLTERSEVISTYALCGFSNIGSIGTMFGALGSLAPNRKGEMAEMALRALIAGNVACFMTACIAGLLYQGDISI